MVDLEKIDSKLLELEFFFKEVINNFENIDNSSYGAGADYGLNSVKNMQILLDKYKINPKKMFLKQLNAGFTSVTRGVEGFNNYNLNEKFREACKGINEIKQNIDENSK